MNNLKSKLPAVYLLLIVNIFASCSKKTENTVTEADSNNIAFTATTPTLGVVPFNARVRDSNPVLMAKQAGKIYVFCKTSAGGDFSVSGYNYDVNSNIFTAVKTLSTGAFINSNGFNSSLISFDTNSTLWYSSPNISLIYNVSGDSWTSYQSTGQSGSNNGVCTMQSKVYYAGNAYTGGANPTLTASSSFTSMDLLKSTWSTMAYLPYLAENPALQTYNNQFIYAIGGEKLSSGTVTRKFSVYNSQTNTWETLPNLPFDYYASTNQHSTTILKNKYLLAYTNNKVYLYNLATKQWNNNPVVDLGQVTELTFINMFNNSNLNSEESDAFYLTGMNVAGEFKITKYTIK